ncbi:C3a anaphylatoxin chemotactic receptor-like [Exaiptasia diaphana]|uniref:G-protein coupled receptors family 1 profile domain-containing protein n=1 Tax=Exaiptasia diaphana TaxID=2652724 RepID=A0A913YYH5_EXADI|nr:C3a anaphylatoxin chemotactic receptor-like [Exaiptasia diaphana]
MDGNISLTNQSNTSSRFCKYDEPDTDIEKTAKRAVFVLFFVLGICGNIFVIILAAKYTVRKNINHWIINMAVSDAIYLISFLILEIPWLSDNKWSDCPNGMLGIVLCDILQFLLRVSMRVSLITLFVVSIKRFRVTTHTIQRSLPFTPRQLMTAVAVCWLIPIPITAYRTYGSNWFVTVAEAILLVILCCIIFVLSIITIRRLSQPHAIQAHLNQQRRNAQRRQMQRAMRMVLVSVLLYTCCWTPSLIIHVMFSLEQLSIQVAEIVNACIDWDSLEFIFDYILPFVNSCFSPLICIICLPDFRQAAKHVLCRTAIQSREPNSQNSTELQSHRVKPFILRSNRVRNSETKSSE